VLVARVRCGIRAHGGFRRPTTAAVAAAAAAERQRDRQVHREADAAAEGCDSPHTAPIALTEQPRNAQPMTTPAWTVCPSNRGRARAARGIVDA